jgi:glycosyltransferase involved in cell wall biosynthesis
MKVAILGIVGVPARYGGFETLAENLVRYHAESRLDTPLTVWCSAKDNTEQPERLENAKLRYVKFSANGIQSIPYDAVSLWQAISSGHDRILLLGVSGAIMLPLIRLVSRVRIVTNIDGVEWKREKWTGFARCFLRFSEWVAVRFSHAVIADNQAIADHVSASYGRDCHVIAYGGDHALLSHAYGNFTDLDLPDSYSLALCRIEPENNVHIILQAWSQLKDPLVFVGNWTNSRYGRELKKRYAHKTNILLLEPIYEPNALYAVREGANIYVHGHSAGGTNPSLVEMMHFGIPVLAYNCIFNHHSTRGKARYFGTSEELIREVRSITPRDAKIIGGNLRELARR